MKARVAQLEWQQAPQTAERLEASPSISEGRGWTPQDGCTAPTGTANEVEYLSVAAMGEPEKRDAFIHGTSFVTMVQEVTRLSTLSGPMPRPCEEENDAATLSLEWFDEDSRKSCGYGLRHFAEAYGQGLHQLLPCVSPNTWSEVLDLATSIEQGTATGIGREPVLELLLCFFTCLGALNTADYSTTKGPVRRLAQRCAWQLPAALHDASDLHAVCYLFLASLLCLYMFEATSSWNFAGLALTKAISSGFHRASFSLQANEAPSTLFWSLHILDRAFAAVLDRPLSIEDGDMTIQLPLATPLTYGPHEGIHVQALSTWIIHYSHMVSGWRRDLASDAELATCVESLAYWRDTCREIELPNRAGGHDVSDTDTGHLLAKAIESRLTCRALVQLFTRLTATRQISGLLSQCNVQVEVEVPRFLTAYKAALDAHVIGPTILDVWSIFGATVAFVASCQPSLSGQLQDSVQPAFGIGVAVMKVVSACIDLLRVISVRCDAALDLQDVLWAFLLALESSGRSASCRASVGLDNVHALNSSISQCRLSVPRHQVKIMHLALALDP